jgi:hypothetical protein
LTEERRSADGMLGKGLRLLVALGITLTFRYSMEELEGVVSHS